MKAEASIHIRNTIKLVFFNIIWSILIPAASILPATLATHDKSWNGPTVGPVAQHNKTVIFLASDFRNGGVSGVFRAFQMASLKLGWTVKSYDGRGNISTLTKAFTEAIKMHPDGCIFGGFQTREFSKLVKMAKKAKIILVGWHAASHTGPTKNLFTNVSTEAKAVAKLAVEYALKTKHGKLGAVLLNDRQFIIANKKTSEMERILSTCITCKILSIKDLSISQANTEVPDVVYQLNKRFGQSWTHTFAINDAYFDNINFPLKAIERPDILNIAAGDGSRKALSRIRSGLSQQVATVAEPLNTQGWQLADELNRAFAGYPPSGYITKPILVTTNLLRKINDTDLEQDIDYEEAYLAIWQGRSRK